MRRLLWWLVAFALPLGAYSGTAAARDEVRIAAQFGLGYAPLYILAKKPEFLHKYSPGIDVTVVQLAGGAGVREALLSDSVDVGGLAMSPVIQAWAKGADLKIALGLSDMPAQLITWEPNLKSVRDLKPDDKLNVISIGSPQTLMVKMAAAKYFGSPNALDHHFVTLPHPDGVAALIAKRDIVASFATPPYIRILLTQPGMHTILSNKDFPEANFMLIIAAAGKSFAEGKPKLYAATMAALTDIIDWMNAKPEEAAEVLAAQPPHKLTAADWLAEMHQPGVRFSAVPDGLVGLSKFMHGIGMTSKAGTFDELTWPNLHGKGGT